MKLISKIIIAPLLLLCFLSSAQVHTNFNNETLIDEKGRFIKPYKVKVDFEMAAKNITNLLQSENQKNDTANAEQLFKIAVPVSVDLNIAKLINWNKKEDTAFGKFTIKLNGALSTSINFDRFYLPQGTEIYIYNEKGNMITGPITETENNPNKIWGSWVYKGPWLTVEVKTPLLTMNQLILHANNIAHGYKEVYQQIGNFGQSQSCEINVVCPLGNGWQNERNAVALCMTGDGNGFFSGSLIMNTCSTNRPFLLTADHIYQHAQPVTGWRFTFQAWSSTCPNPGTNVDGIMYNGSTLRANSAGSDFCLVELNNTPPTNSGINYAGWSRNTGGITQTTIIHHPMGDLMKITRDNNPPTSSGFLNAQCWHLIVDNGITEAGSSGAPYFDQNHRIIGQHDGIDDGNLTICNQVSKYGGRFDISWTGGGTNATRLSNWLDPNNTGVLTTNTTNVSTLSNYSLSLSITGGSNVICSGSSTYTLNGAPLGANIVWAISNTSIASLTSNGNQATVTKTGTGTLTLTATVGSTNCFVNNVAIRAITLGVVPIVPSFTPGSWTNIPNPPSTVYGTGCFTSSNKGMTFTYSNVTNLTAIPFNNNSYPYVVGNVIAWDYPIGLSSGLLRVGYNNGCGQVDQILSISTSCSGFTYTVNPNPASSEINVTLNNDLTKTQAGDIWLKEIGIYDQQGNLKKRFKYSKTKTAKINVSNLISGTYFIELISDQNRERQQLIIQR